MDLSEECRSACAWLQDLAKRVGEDPLPEGTEALALMLVQVRETALALTECRRFLEQETHVRLADTQAAAVTLPDGTTVKRSSRWSRKNVDREGLVNSIRNHPAASRVDPETGELHSDSEAFSELLLRCFRQEPRWKALQDLDIEEDDYCEKELVATVVVSTLGQPEAS